MKTTAETATTATRFRCLDDGDCHAAAVMGHTDIPQECRVTVTVEHSPDMAPAEPPPCPVCRGNMEEAEEAADS